MSKAVPKLLYALVCLWPVIQSIASPVEAGKQCAPLTHLSKEELATEYERSVSEGRAVSADPRKALKQIESEIRNLHDSAPVSTVLDVIAMKDGKVPDTQALLKGVSRVFGELGGGDEAKGRAQVILSRNGLEAASSNLRNLQRILEARGDTVAAEQTRMLYDQNQAKLARVRLALSFHSWKRAQELGLAEVKVVSGEDFDSGSLKFAKRDTHTVRDVPALAIQTRYTHHDLIKLLREGKIDQELYYALTFSRRVNSESDTGMAGASWFASDGNYGRTQIIQKTGNLPHAVSTFEGKLDSNGGHWLRAVAPEGSFMIMRLPDQAAHSDPRFDPQGAPTRPEFHWIKSDNREENDVGEKWATHLFGKDHYELMTEKHPFTSFDYHPIESLYGPVPAQKWDGGSIHSNSQGKFITETFEDLRDLRLQFEVDLYQVPNVRGYIQSLQGGKEHQFQNEIPEALPPDIDPESFQAKLKAADDALVEMGKRAERYLEIIQKYKTEGKHELEKATYLDYIRFLCEVKQLHEMRSDAARSLRKWLKERGIASNEPPPKVHFHPDIPEMTPEILSALKEHQQKFPGSYFSFDSRVLEQVRKIEDRRQQEIQRSKKLTEELAQNSENQYDFVVFDGLVGSYVVQKLVEQGVDPKRILLVGKTEMPFLDFPGISSFEASDRTVERMGVNLQEHAIGYRPTGELVLSTTAVAEANLNGLQNHGVPHAYGNFTAEKQPDGKTKYFLTDPDTGKRAEIQVGHEIFYGPGLKYPESLGIETIVDDIEFYRQAYQKALADPSSESVALIDPSEDVLFIGSGGAQASAEKLRFGKYYFDHIAGGGRPGKTFVVGNKDANNNEPRFLLNPVREGLGEAGLFQFIEGRVDAPARKGGEIQWNGVDKERVFVNGKLKWKVTPYFTDPVTKQKLPLEPIFVDRIINATASVGGSGKLVAEAKGFAPDGFKLDLQENGATSGVVGQNGSVRVSVIGPAGAVVIGAQARAKKGETPNLASANAVLNGVAREQQGQNRSTPNAGLDRNGNYISDVGPFATQAAIADARVESSLAAYSSAGGKPLQTKPMQAGVP